MESSTATSADIQNGSLSVISKFVKTINKYRIFLLGSWKWLCTSKDKNWVQINQSSASYTWQTNRFLILIFWFSFVFIVLFSSISVDWQRIWFNANENFSFKTSFDYHSIHTSTTTDGNVNFSRINRQFLLFSSKKTHLSLDNSSQFNEKTSLDENTRPFSLIPRERDCDEYNSHSNRNADNNDLNDIYSATLKDLDFEREKRWRAEQEIQQLNHLLADLKQKQKDPRSNETILQELSDKHQQRLADEKSKFQDLTAILDDYKVENSILFFEFDLWFS